MEKTVRGDVKDLQQQVQTLSKALTEQILLRDVLLLISTTNNAYDRGIVEKLIKGDKLDDGEWQHIFGEAGRLQLPEQHALAMQRIYQRITSPPKEKSGGNGTGA